MTSFRHKIHHIKIMLRNTKMLCESLKPFLLRIRAYFIELQRENKKVTRLDSKLTF